MSLISVVPLQQSYNRDFLLTHCRDILAFYTPRLIDSSGGFFHNYLDDGSLFNPGFRQLVSSTRLIVNYARASVELNQPEYKAVVLHGLQYLEQVHYQNDSQCYAWTLQDHQPQDMTQQAYGYAFVLLAYSAVQCSKRVLHCGALKLPKPMTYWSSASGRPNMACTPMK